jgi:hypothetical protein
MKVQHNFNEKAVEDILRLLKQQVIEDDKAIWPLTHHQFILQLQSVGLQSRKKIFICDKMDHFSLSYSNSSCDLCFRKFEDYCFDFDLKTLLNCSINHLYL